MDTASIFKISNAQDFETIALQVFKFQFENTPVYRSFCDLLYKHPSDVKSITDIPFLPIHFFKTHQVLTKHHKIATSFTSSGTTGSTPSQHHVSNLSLYETSFRKGFESLYGSIEDYTILALLPSYLERSGSSLIYMVQDMIQKSKAPDSGFYLNNLEALRKKLITLDSQGKKVLLIGVSFALLDLVEYAKFHLKHTIVMETGGMKGKKKELIRAELHERLKQGFGVSQIHSEYGMTELLSQGYSKGDGCFTSPPWMKVFSRDPQDPLTLLPHSKTGGLNIIDLANYNSCAFIATQDLGCVHNNGTFEVMGRFDTADIRGCNLMVL
jgi:phenylacetate-coenzyme A ligase PaaK-like adenylate-forming protein